MAWPRHRANRSGSCPGGNPLPAWSCTYRRRGELNAAGRRRYTVLVNGLIELWGAGRSSATRFRDYATPRVAPTGVAHHSCHHFLPHRGSFSRKALAFAAVARTRRERSRRPEPGARRPCHVSRARETCAGRHTSCTRPLSVAAARFSGPSRLSRAGD
jgi:hypothetical protein